MWVTLAVRTMTSVLGLVFSLYGGSIGGFVIGTVFTVLGFFFIAYCLAGIGNVQGTRRVLGISMVSCINLQSWDCSNLDSSLGSLALRHIPARVRCHSRRPHIHSILPEVEYWLHDHLVRHVVIDLCHFLDHHLDTGTAELCITKSRTTQV